MTDGVFKKRPNERRLYNFDFQNFPELQAGQTLSSVQTYSRLPASSLTLNSATISGTVVQLDVSGGTDGVTYVVLVRVVTSGGQVLQGSISLIVEEAS